MYRPVCSDHVLHSADSVAVPKPGYASEDTKSIETNTVELGTDSARQSQPASPLTEPSSSPPLHEMSLRSQAEKTATEPRGDDMPPGFDTPPRINAKPSPSEHVQPTPGPVAAGGPLAVAVATPTRARGPAPAQAPDPNGWRHQTPLQMPHNQRTFSSPLAPALMSPTLIHLGPSMQPMVFMPRAPAMYPGAPFTPTGLPQIPYPQAMPATFPTAFPPQFPPSHFLQHQTPEIPLISVLPRAEFENGRQVQGDQEEEAEKRSPSPDEGFKKPRPRKGRGQARRTPFPMKPGSHEGEEGWPTLGSAKGKAKHKTPNQTAQRKRLPNGLAHRDQTAEVRQRIAELLECERRGRQRERLAAEKILCRPVDYTFRLEQWARDLELHVKNTEKSAEHLERVANERVAGSGFLGS